MKFCANCGQPAHRYGSTDPEHKPNLMGCINALRHQLELREAALRDVAENIPMEHAPMHALDGGWEYPVVTLDNVRKEANDLIEHMRERARGALTTGGVSHRSSEDSPD